MTGNLGATLREARERKGISLRQIATATKIAVAALESIERNDFSKLPGGIFGRSFVRSYAIEVGLDPDETVHEFLELIGEEQPAGPQDADRRGPLSHEGRSSAAHHPAASEWTNEFDFESKQRMAAVVLKLVLLSIPVGVAILYYSSRGFVPSAGTLAQESALPPSASERAPIPVASPGEQTVHAPEPASATSTPAPAASPGLTIEIAPSADCWVQLSADGEVVLSRMLKPGERESRYVRDAAILQVGDAAACAISINGRLAKPLGHPNQARRVQITRDNYLTLLR